MGMGMSRSERATNGAYVRRLMRNQRGMSTGHAVVLGLGILVLLFGVYLIAAAYLSWVPTVSVLIIGLILVFLGLAETLVEGEYDRTPRRR